MVLLACWLDGVFGYSSFIRVFSDKPDIRSCRVAFWHPGYSDIWKMSLDLLCRMVNEEYVNE